MNIVDAYPGIEPVLVIAQYLEEILAALL